ADGRGDGNRRGDGGLRRRSRRGSRELRLGATVPVDLVAVRRLGAMIVAVAHAVAVGVGVAAPLVDDAAPRRVDAVVDAVEHTVLVHVDGGPLEARSLRIPVLVGVRAAGLGTNTR